jgi:hypothetical protein
MKGKDLHEVEGFFAGSDRSTKVTKVTHGAPKATCESAVSSIR